ncbi:MAG: class I SAM-dependent methyltransferase [Oscillospiraceae bacterium]|nr:class I SAM-dependent methyltransferase [Oscillospiraceae bacterium]
MSLNKYLSRQLSSPEGAGGKVVSFFMNRINCPMYEETIRLLSLADSDSVLDIGCGNGYVLNMIARRHSGAFTGIDLSASMVDAANQRNRQFVESGRMRFACQDLSAMSFASGSFSKVYTINTVYFWDDLENVMAEISRVLEPNGLFANTLYSNDALSKLPHTKYGYKCFTQEQLTTAGTNAGFKVNTVPIPGGAAFCYLYQKTAE